MFSIKKHFFPSWEVKNAFTVGFGIKMASAKILFMGRESSSAIRDPVSPNGGVANSDTVCL